MVPFPTYPGLQVQRCPLIVLVQIAFSSQLCCPLSHSSRSTKTKAMQENVRERKGRINFQLADLTFQKSFITSDCIATTDEQHKRGIGEMWYQVHFRLWFISGHLMYLRYGERHYLIKSISKEELSKTKCWILIYFQSIIHHVCSDATCYSLDQFRIAI